MDERGRGAATRQSWPKAGMPVVSNTSWTGTVAEVLAASPSEEGAIRVAWDGDGETIVPQHACTITGGKVIVQFAAEAESGMGTRPDAMRIDGEQITVPIIEEDLSTATVWRDVGSVMIRMHAENLPQSFTAETEREELVVDQVNIGRELAAGEIIAPRQEGDRYIIPIVVEEAVVVKRRVLVHELVVTKRSVSTTQTIETTIRRVRPEIESGALADRTHIASGVAQ